jgi:hypothetical protein
MADADLAILLEQRRSGRIGEYRAYHTPERMARLTASLTGVVRHGEAEIRMERDRRALGKDPLPGALAPLLEAVDQARRVLIVAVHDYGDDD